MHGNVMFNYSLILLFFHSFTVHTISLSICVLHKPWKRTFQTLAIINVWPEFISFTPLTTQNKKSAFGKRKEWTVKLFRYAYTLQTCFSYLLQFPMLLIASAYFHSGTGYNTCSNGSNTRWRWSAYRCKQVSESKLNTAGEETHNTYLEYR
jgi:hypothetical protein